MARTADGRSRTQTRPRTRRRGRPALASPPIRQSPAPRRAGGSCRYRHFPRSRQTAHRRSAPRRSMPPAPRPGLRAQAARPGFRPQEGHSPAPSPPIRRPLRTDSLEAWLGLAPTRGRPVRESRLARPSLFATPCSATRPRYGGGFATRRRDIVTRVPGSQWSQVGCASGCCGHGARGGTKPPASSVSIRSSPAGPSGPMTTPSSLTRSAWHYSSSTSLPPGNHCSDMLKQIVRPVCRSPGSPSAFVRSSGAPSSPAFGQRVERAACRSRAPRNRRRS